MEEPRVEKAASTFEAVVGLTRVEAAELAKDKATLLSEIVGTFDSVEAFYHELRPEKATLFFGECYAMMLSLESSTQKIIDGWESGDGTFVIPAEVLECFDAEDTCLLRRVLVVCAYAMSAFKALREGFSHWAWFDLLDAQYLLGFIIGERTQTNRNIDFRRLGRSGAAKRHAKTQALKDWTIARYREGKWPSANKAAYDLKRDVINHGRTIGAHLSEENAQKTIADWIRKSV